ncbi:U3 small nucleolar RNA-associated protein 14 homolog A-like [Macrobrachium nipponense]|uniref:U3 small nucleolar RNA-associated protein 14 homolog A-like n=1 Tax=Macrobrachium nipponense TaxID=159736 RepID=UPI0030C8B098
MGVKRLDLPPILERLKTLVCTVFVAHKGLENIFVLGLENIFVLGQQVKTFIEVVSQNIKYKNANIELNVKSNITRLLDRKKDEDDANLFITGPVDLAEEDLAGSDGEAESEDERAHNNLLSDIGKLSKKKRMGAAPRSVRFSTREGGTEVNTQDILKRIGLPELEKTAKKLKTLSVPLEKVAVKRVKRAAGYDKVACESEKWAGLVHKRRTEEQLVFPLQQPDLRLYTAIKSDAKMRSDLEKEVYALLQGAKLVEDKQEANEKKERERALSLEELKERNRLLWKEREQRRRIQRKAWMQNKNKSRKFHRLLRKDRLKKQRQELEELQKSNPEAALGKLEELERARVQERMTLRHKHSKWAHLQGLRVARDETARSALKENQSMHQDLVAKRKMDDSSGDEEEDEEMLKEKLESLRKEKQDAIEAGLFDPSNPWTANLLRQTPGRAEVTPESAIDDSFTNFKRFWDEVNRRRLIEKKALEVVAEKERRAQANEKENDDDEGEDHSDESVEETTEKDEKEVEEPGNEMNGDAEKTEVKVAGKKKKKIKKAKDGSQEGSTSNDKTDAEVDKENLVKEGDQKALKKTKAKKKQKKQKNVDDNLKTSSEDAKKLKKAKKNEAMKNDNDTDSLEKSKTEGKKMATKKEKVKKKEKTKKKKGKKTEEQKEENGTEIKTDSKESEDLEDLEDHLVSIDNMFSRAEIGLQKKLKRKLEKLGIGTKEEWTVVKSKKRQKKTESSLPKIEEFEFSTSKSQDNIDEGLEQVRTLEDIDNLQQRSEEKDVLQKAVQVLKSNRDAKSVKGALQNGTGTNSQSDKKAPSKAAKLDPSKFLQVDAKVLRAAMPNTISEGIGLDDDDEDDEGEDANDVIQQAFAEDYLVDEFKSAKDEAIERDKPKALSLVLPGWGEWTGPNIQVSKRKKRRFAANMPKPPPRKDDTMGNVIYNEKADVHSNLRKAMVSELPYPFSRVQDFEASIRAPVGRMFIPEKQHQKLTMPPVVTKMGAVIEPMTEEELLKNKDVYEQKQKREELAEKKRKGKLRNRAKRQKKKEKSVK